LVGIMAAVPEHQLRPSQPQYDSHRSESDPDDDDDDGEIEEPHQYPRPRLEPQLSSIPVKEPQAQHTGIAAYIPPAKRKRMMQPPQEEGSESTGSATGHPRYH
jgi:hypothetical protein